MYIYIYIYILYIHYILYILIIKYWWKQITKSITYAKHVVNRIQLFFQKSLKTSNFTNFFRNILFYSPCFILI